MPDSLSGPAVGPAPRLQYVRLPVGDPVAAATFAERIVGLPWTTADEGGTRSRADAAAWRIGWIPRHQPACVGLDLATDLSFAQAVCRLRAVGCGIRDLTSDECRVRAVAHGVVADGPGGWAVELVLRPDVLAQRFRPVTDTAVGGLGPVGLRSVDVARDLRVWTEGLGAQVADRVGDIVYLRFGVRHHDLVLYPSPSAGVLYTTLDVDGFDSLMIDWYALQETGVEMVHGPGREAASGHRFVRFVGPDGHLLAFGWGMDAAADASPRQFQLEPAALCTWGSRCTSVLELDPGQVDACRPVRALSAADASTVSTADAGKVTA